MPHIDAARQSSCEDPYGGPVNDTHTRAYRADDAAAVADLLNAVAKAGGGHGGHLAAEVEDFLAHEVRELATDSRVITDRERLVAAAFVPVPAGGGTRVELHGGVAPDRRGAGIGRDLLAWQLNRAAKLRAEVAPAAQWEAQVVVGVSDASAIRLVERFGFTVARYFLAMTAPAVARPVAPPADGVRITTYDHGYERELYAVHVAAFRDMWGYRDRAFDSWAAQTVRSETFVPELCRVALAGDTIVGYVFPYGTAEPERLYIGQVGTASSWRRRGIASALLAEVLGAAGRAGYREAALDTDADNPTGAARSYANVGFVVDQHIVAYTKPV